MDKSRRRAGFYFSFSIAIFYGKCYNLFVCLDSPLPHAIGMNVL